MKSPIIVSGKEKRHHTYVNEYGRWQLNAHKSDCQINDYGVKLYHVGGRTEFIKNAQIGPALAQDEEMAQEFAEMEMIGIYVPVHEIH